MKIGLLAGGGDLPKAVIAAAQADGHGIFIAQLDGTDLSVPGIDHKFFRLGEFGKITRAFKKADVSHVCFAGNVSRPDFKKLKPDFKTLTRLPGAIKAAKDGDDALLKYIVKAFEKEGFSILAPQDICKSLLMPSGHLGMHKMTADHKNDAEKAMQIARQIGALDIGQGAVVNLGLVLAVEAQEGTDAMLRRVARLPDSLRGHEQARSGILAKMVKPGQESRVDLPTIGVETVKLASKSGLAGIIVEAGNAFVMDRNAVIEAADQAGVFIVGLPPAENE